MENIPYNGNQEEDQENSFLESFENEDTEEDEESEATSKKKKKAQSYLKVLFRKFFMTDKKEKSEPEASSLGEKIITPFIKFEEVIDLPNPLVERPEKAYAEAQSYDPVEVAMAKNIDGGIEDTYEDEQAMKVYAQITKETDDKTIRREAVDEYAASEKKGTINKDKHHLSQQSHHETEAIGSVMIRRVEKKKIKGLEEEVAKVQKKIKKLEKTKQADPVRAHYTSIDKKASQGLSQERREHVNLKHNTVSIKTTKNKEFLGDNIKDTSLSPIDHKDELSNIRKNIEKQFAKNEKYEHKKQIETLETYELNNQKESTTTEKISFETNKQKNRSTHLNYVSYASRYPLEVNTAKYTMGNSNKPVAKELFQNRLPKNYKQAVALGFSYGATITIIILILIALRMI